MKKIISLIICIFLLDGLLFSQNLNHPNASRYDADCSKMTPKQFFSILKFTSDTAKGVTFMTLCGGPPKTWVQFDDVKYLMKFINSTQKCKCVIQIYSDFIPPDDYYSTLGGQAMNLIDSYRNNESYFQGSWTCAKNDSSRAKSITNWWSALKK